MIGISVSDILKVLDKVPEWVGLKRLLVRIDLLEKRVADLEGRLALASPKAVGEQCPLCEAGTLKVTKVEPDPIFGDMGVQKRTLSCSSCGHQEARQASP